MAKLIPGRLIPGPRPRPDQVPRQLPILRERKFPTRERAALPTFKTIPLLLSSEPVVTPTGAIAVPDHGRLQPEERSAIIVDEIRFTFRSPQTYALPNTGARIRMGDFALTNGFVPIYGLCQLAQKRLFFSDDTAEGEVVDVQYYTMRWRLPSPLFVPIGAVLSTELLQFAKPSGATPAFPVKVDVAYAARRIIENAPSVFSAPVPFATSFNPLTVAKSYTSANNELANSLNKPLYTQRLIGRAVAADWRVKIVDYNGIEIVPANTHFADAFEDQLQTLPLHRTLQPGDGFRATLDHPTNTTEYPSLTLIGTRDERMA